MNDLKADLDNLKLKIKQAEETSNVKDDIGEKLVNAQTQLIDYENLLKTVKEKKEHFTKVDSSIISIVENQDCDVNLNVGGEMFYTKLSTMFAEPGTLLAKLFEEKIKRKDDLSADVVFIDRNSTNFRTILNYLRTKKFSLDGYSAKELIIFKEDCEYFNIPCIVEKINKFEEELIFTSLDAAPRYSTAGTHLLQDLNDRSLTKGICVQSPYHIIIGFNREVIINSIDVGGYNGNTSLWGSTNGSGSKIYTSMNKTTWTEVGTIPSNFGNSIIQVTLKKSTAMFIKFQHTSYLGLGFLKINESAQ